MSDSASARRILPALSGVATLAAVYIYFLIFAQFGFLRLAQAHGVSPANLRGVMACMGVAGVVASLWSGRRFTGENARRLLHWGFAACAAAALLAILARGVVENCLVAALIGAVVGVLTVCLAAGLPQVLGARRVGLKAGLGTGAAYAVCNIPAVFSATAAQQAIFATAVCLVGFFALRGAEFSAEVETPAAPFALPFAALIVAFLALVWMDSAAFYILQETPSLNCFGWSTANLQWQNAAIHFVAAVLAGLWLDRGGLTKIALPAFALLAGAVFCASRGNGFIGAATHWLYAAGVSLYSTGLVFTPTASSPRDPRAAARRAGVLFAIAGWVGSALGIGMAQDLHAIPGWFVGVGGFAVVSATVFSCGLRFRDVAPAVLILGVSGIFLLAVFQARAVQQRSEPSAELGREVYISEGCIHCHSQYVRPESRDEEWWGPVISPGQVLAQPPPLIGNRRQGPDLLNVGNRRSPQWNRLHLRNPRATSPDSVMPSYAHLFRPGDARGDALVQYLAELGADTFAARERLRGNWMPSAIDGPPKLADGRALFQNHCAQCHGSEGTGDGLLAKDLGGWLPRNLTLAQWQRIPHRDDARDQLVEIARLVKFGVSGTPMAGHEYWSDRELFDVAAYVQSLAQQETKP